MRLHVATRVRWSDLDAYGHVNNTDMFRLLEEARIDAFWSGGRDDGPAAILDAGPGADTLSFIAHQEIEYLEPIPYLRDPLDVQMWVAKLGGASLSVCYEVHAPDVAGAGASGGVGASASGGAGAGGGGGADASGGGDGSPGVDGGRDAGSGLLYARAETTLVLVDAATRRPRRIRDDERAAWERYVEAPVRFARRR